MKLLYRVTIPFSGVRGYRKSMLHVPILNFLNSEFGEVNLIVMKQTKNKH